MPYPFRALRGSITESRSETRGSEVRRSAIRAAFTALTALIALRSIQDLYPTRHRVTGEAKAMLHAISAAIQTCAGLPPSSSVSPAAAIEHATPTFALTPHFRAGYRGVHLVQHANRPRRQQIAGDRVGIDQHL